MVKKATPAQRARARRDPAIFQPPPKIKADRRALVRGLVMRVAGRTYPLGPHVEGDTPWGFGMEQTGTVSLPVRDPTDSIVSILDDENLIQNDGVMITIDKVIYVVSTVDCDGEGLYTLTLEDEVSWRLGHFSSYKTATRGSTTRFGFIYSFVDEASRKPYPPMAAFIPEIDDKQPIRRPKRQDKDKKGKR